MIFLACLVACTGPKKVAHRPSPDPKPSDKNEDLVPVYDPATGRTIMVPRGSVKVDTVNWNVDSTSAIITDKVDPKPEKKDEYHISLLMPFTTPGDPTDNFEGRMNRFLHYYAGVQMAMDEVDTFRNRIFLHAYDEDGDIGATQSLLRKPELREADIIIGPYEKEGVELVAAFGLKNEAQVISPWLPAFSIDEPNPNFIQVNPGLATHADAISSYIAANYPKNKVYLVSRDATAEMNRLNLFKRNRKLTPTDLVIKDSSPELARTDLKVLLSDQPTIFVLPYYSKADEAFVNSFLRKLHADKEDKEVIVFGLPQWLGFSNLSANYMESLSAHVSVSSFINIDHPDYLDFRKEFFNRYHTVPDLQAFLGYDLIKWLTNMVAVSGKDALISSSSTWLSGIATGFDIRPVYKSGVILDKEELKTPLYYENMRIRILKYEGQDFHLVN